MTLWLDKQRFSSFATFCWVMWSFWSVFFMWGLLPGAWWSSSPRTGVCRPNSVYQPSAACRRSTMSKWLCKCSKAKGSTSRMSTVMFIFFLPEWTAKHSTPDSISPQQNEIQCFFLCSVWWCLSYIHCVFKRAAWAPAISLRTFVFITNSCSAEQLCEAVLAACELYATMWSFARVLVCQSNEAAQEEVLFQGIKEMSKPPQNKT